jgi:hypothetical protein
MKDDARECEELLCPFGALFPSLSLFPRTRKKNFENSIQKKHTEIKTCRKRSRVIIRNATKTVAAAAAAARGTDDESVRVERAARARFHLLSCVVYIFQKRGKKLIFDKP